MNPITMPPAFTLIYGLESTARRGRKARCRARVDAPVAGFYRGRMMTQVYPVLKIIHASCALLTLLLFVWRGRLAVEGVAIPRRWLRWVPDSVDSLLLGTGIALVFVTAQYPFVADWVTAKLAAVIIYIALGFIVFRFGKTRMQRKAAWLAAMGVFSAIVWLAHFHQFPAWFG